GLRDLKISRVRAHGDAVQNRVRQPGQQTLLVVRPTSGKSPDTCHHRERGPESVRGDRSGQRSADEVAVAGRRDRFTGCLLQNSQPRKRAGEIAGAVYSARQKWRAKPGLPRPRKQSRRSGKDTDERSRL